LNGAWPGLPDGAADGVTQVETEIWGAGSGSWASTSAVSGGGGGGYARKRIVGLTPGTAIAITVGQGDYAGATGSAPGSGSASSFGTTPDTVYCSATGGTVNPNNSLTQPSFGGLGGGGIGGDVNSTGSDGVSAQGSVGGMGGAVSAGTYGVVGHSPGGGASGAGNSGSTAFNGAAGADGLVVVRW
jgi:hypothetical protein